MSSEVRAELAKVAASLRAYLEWQEETGARGVPRKPRGITGDPPTAVAPAVQEREAPVHLAPEPPPPPPPRKPPPAAAAPVNNPSDSPPPSFEVKEIAPPTPSRRGTVNTAAAAPIVVTPTRPLPILEAEVKTCTKCALGTSRTNTVFSRGNPESKICFVGEAPGADEDAQGIPFVGRAGQLLDKMIQAMGLDPAKDVYVCNIIKCRPPGNRRPEPEEIDTCIPYLHEQLAVVDPKVIVALGNTAVGALLNTKLGITKVRGSWKLYRGKTPVMPTYHPSYLLRPSTQQAEAKRQAWEDLQAVMKELGLSRKA